MPTGYTHNLPNTLGEFARRCAQAFLPECRTLEILPDPDENELLPEIETLTAKLDNPEKIVQELIQSHQKYLENSEALRVKYDDMLAKLRAWEAPEGLQLLKAFMLQQLQESKRFDCPEHPFPWKPPTVEDVIQEITAQIANRRESHQRAKERNANQNAFIENVLKEFPS